MWFWWYSILQGYGRCWIPWWCNGSIHARSQVSDSGSLLSQDFLWIIPFGSSRFRRYIFFCSFLCRRFSSSSLFYRFWSARPNEVWTVGESWLLPCQLRINFKSWDSISQLCVKKIFLLLLNIPTPKLFILNIAKVPKRRSLNGKLLFKSEEQTLKKAFKRIKPVH